MNKSIIISQHVLNSLNSLPEEERIAIAGALAGELLLGGKVSDELTPMQMVVYNIIRDYIRRDSFRAAV